MMKKKKSEEGFEFCEVCKLNHNQARRHNFFPNHKRSLEAQLSRFRSKLADLRFFLKHPTPLRPEHASLNRLWCLFCQFDILELSSFYTSENAIAHLASEDHLKKVKGFLWKYGGGMDKIDCYRITEADFAKWEKQCKASNSEAAGEGSHGALIGPSNVMRDLRYTIQSYQSHRVVVLIHITVMQAYHVILLLMDLYSQMRELPKGKQLLSVYQTLQKFLHQYKKTS